MYKSIPLFAIAALTIGLSGYSYADPIASSASQSAAGSYSGSGAIAGSAGNVINIGSGGGSGARGAGGPAIGSTLDYRSTSNDNRTFNTNYDLSETVPNLWVPGPGGGGSNPCVVSGSAGGVASGWGFGFSRSWNDQECQVRETMRVVGGQMNPNSPQADRLMKNIACQSEIMQTAMRESGLRCVNDPVKRARRSTRVAAVSTTSYASAVSKCRGVSDSAYGGCMRRAKALR